jgi:hypothetical protein
VSHRWKKAPRRGPLLGDLNRQRRDVLKPLVFFAGLLSPAVSCTSLSTFSVVSGSPGLAAVIASPLTGLLVEFSSEDNRVAGKRSEAARRGWVILAVAAEFQRH